MVKLNKLLIHVYRLTKCLTVIQVVLKADHEDVNSVLGSCKPKIYNWASKNGSSWHIRFKHVFPKLFNQI